MLRPLVALALASALVLVGSNALAETVAPLPEVRDAAVLTREIDAGVGELSGALRDARARGDLRHAATLSDRLSQAHAAARRARELRAALAETIEAATRAVRSTELRTLRARVRRLVDDSRDAESARANGGTRVTVVIDASVPTTEPTRPST